MKNISGLIGETLTIYQPSIWKNFYELKHGDNILGTINQPKIFSRRILFKFDNHEWEIYFPKFWKSEIAIRESGFQLPYATYKRDNFKMNGTLFLPRGERLKFVFKMFKGGYRIENNSGISLVSFKDKFALKSTTEIKIEQPSELLDKYPWAIVLIWYIAYKRKQAAAHG